MLGQHCVLLEKEVDSDPPDRKHLQANSCAMPFKYQISEMYKNSSHTHTKIVLQLLIRDETASMAELKLFNLQTLWII